MDLFTLTCLVGLVTLIWQLRTKVVGWFTKTNSYTGFSGESADVGTCSADTDLTMFSETYNESRTRFLFLAKECMKKYPQARFLSKPLTELNKENNIKLAPGSAVPMRPEDYTVDAIFFPGNKENLLLHTSGTHGVEGYCGTGIQCNLLKTLDESFPNLCQEDSPSVLIIHAVNPFGMAHCYRWNENRVDLNRNVIFGDYDENHNWENYQPFSEQLNPVGPPGRCSKMVFLFKMLRNMLCVGRVMKMKAAIVGGQYKDSTKLMYGGKSLQQTHRIFRDIVHEFGCETMRRVFMIDVHTGLGPPGQDTLMNKGLTGFVPELFKDTHYGVKVGCCGKRKDFVSAFGNKNEGHGAAKGYANTKGTQGDQGKAPWWKNLEEWYEVGQEWGTVPMAAVFHHLQTENRVYHHYGLGSPEHTRVARKQRDMFYLSDCNDWKQRVLTGGLLVTRRVYGRLGQECSTN